LKRKLLVLGIIIMMTSLFVKLEPDVNAQPGSEYQRYVLNYSNGTYIGKPMFPVLINDSQILVGQNWTIVCPLEAAHSYHAYLYGAWVNNGSQPKTDYNVYVYDPNGALVGIHTESAGLLEHLGDTVDTPFFTPEKTGNYTFIIANNAGTSQAAQQATFMIIENIQTNTWYQQYIAGQIFGMPMFNTSWAYDFVTNSQNVEVQVKVPYTLDMYEARLYVMADPTVPNETVLDGVPLAWEPGLYGNTTSTTMTGTSGTNATIGGYNLDAEGYRGVAYASCEYPGQDMLINYTSPHRGQTLYHLVLIGEYGSGTVDFLVKTIFDASLQPSIVPGNVYLDTDATISYVLESTDLINATLRYSTNNWTTTTTIPMEISDDNRTCTAVIPAQAASTLVTYSVQAYDYLEDLLVASGNYTVRQSSLTFLTKPMFPVIFNNSQIEIGRDWSVVTTLQAGHSYHAYLYGAFANNGSQPKTEYDVYLYDPNDTLVGYHTESAGLLQHLGDTVDAPYFTAKSTGNYTFIIANNAGASQAAQQATFMIIENIQLNTWHQQYIEGEDNNNSSALNTSWAYDFVTGSKQVEVDVKVPDALDMYEARLYLMADPTVANETILNDVPLAWELGLYGNRTGIFGGYNLNSEGYRGVAYASCEYPGQDMLINYTSPDAGQTLYHLVLIGEYGSGTVQFRVKTVFDPALLPSIVPDKVYPDTDVTIAYVSKSTDLINATLRYSTNNWTTTTTIPMEISDDNRTCTATIPRQAADTFVFFGVEAYDSLDNRLIAYGNYTVIRSSTYLEKPMSPVWFDDSQMEIGRNWNVTCLLEANRTYHVYLYGAWVNNGSNPKTDYNVYVYDPYGNSESNHTASAGLLQHLGDTSDTPFFTPKYSGNYTFQIVNSAEGSVEAQQATFMIIEDVEPNTWNQRYIEGTNNGVPTLNTSWGYEFVTDSQNVQILISVPDTLTMYEARLYPMADPTIKNETILDGVPLAWEPGLYGNTTSTTTKTGTSGTNATIGGYNLDAEGYRGVAFATCDHAGQDMLINYTSSHAGQTLYHLVLIGGKGSGTVEFLVKTIFNASLQASIAPGRLYPNDTGLVAYVSTSTDLVNATLQYSTNNWVNATTIPMEIFDNRTCRTTIPGQVAGTNVVYGIEATDLLTDILVANGSYTVKNPSMLNITVIRPTVTFGDNITVKGFMTPQAAGMPITVYFDSGNDSESIVCFTLADGSFTASLRSNAIGTWNVQAVFYEDASTYGSMSQQLVATVEGPSFLAQYSLYIGLGVGAAAAGSAILMLYLRKWRGRALAEEEW